MHKLLLTFDVEDFVNANEITSLRIFLEMLEKYKLKGLFFITGHMAEKLGSFPDLVELLENHEIGFHSSGHSVHPTIPEYTDIESYEQAYQISLKRETSHINPLTGQIEGKGGIHLLQELFRPKKIRAFRAPGMSWTPPNLEALFNLGIRFDFSSSISNSEPINYNGITFYPYTFMQQWDASLSDYQCLISALLKRKVAVFDLHPTLYVNRYEWDSIFYRGNPVSLTRVPERTSAESLSLFKGFDMFLKRIRFLEKSNIVATDPTLSASRMELRMSKDYLEKVYNWSMRWPRKRFHYEPKFVRAHFYKFFEKSFSQIPLDIK
jgi:peptidoglycan/xylan/chitin deacetylase (PgdA/CDA1 family)